MPPLKPVTTDTHHQVVVVSRLSFLRRRVPLPDATAGVIAGLIFGERDAPVHIQPVSR